MAVALALSAAVFLSFLPVLRNGFVNWDDDLNLTDNLAYRGLSAAHLHWMFTTTLGGHYQPLSWLSFAVDHALWGMDPTGYHLTNLGLHAANTLLVYLLASALLRLACGPGPGIRVAAAVAALCFGVHPLRVESVAWATERRDVLSGCFYLLALLVYVRAHSVVPRRRALLAVSVAALAVSLLAKAWGMTLPLVLLILDAYPLRRLRRGTVGTVLLEKVPYAILAVVAAIVAFVAQRSVEEMRSLAEHSLPARVAQGAYGLCFYLWKTLVPLRLSPAYLLDLPINPVEWRYALSMLAAAAVTIIALALRRRRPWLLAAWAAYVVVVAPVLGVAQTGPQLVADRYTYLSCIPWAVLAGAAVLSAWRSAGSATRRTGIAVVSGSVLAALAVLTFRQAELWSDSLTLWSHVLRVDPTNYVAYTNRGQARADLAVAIADYSEAVRLNPRYYLAYFNRGNARHERDDVDGAIADFTTAIAILPGDAKAYNNRGWAKEARGDWIGAAADYARALEIAPAAWRHRELVEGNLRRVRERAAAGSG